MNGKRNCRKEKRLFYIKNNSWNEVREQKKPEKFLHSLHHRYQDTPLLAERFEPGTAVMTHALANITAIMTFLP